MPNFRRLRAPIRRARLPPIPEGSCEGTDEKPQESGWTRLESERQSVEALTAEMLLLLASRPSTEEPSRRKRTPPTNSWTEETIRSKSRRISPSSNSERDLASAFILRDHQALAMVKPEVVAKDDNWLSLSNLQPHHEDATGSRDSKLSSIIRKAQELDLAFLVDATRSMKRCIDMVKNEVVSVAEAIAKAHPQLKLRVAFVSYRDYDDPPYKTLDFTTSFRGEQSFFVRALADVKASGAGLDAAEDVFSGLERVANLSWQAANRVLIHIADAPCHGRRFHHGVGDRYPNGDIYGRDVGVLLKTLRKRCRISTYTFCHLNRSTRKMVREFEKEVGGGWIQQELFANISDIPLKVVAVSQETISSTISSTLSSLGVDEDESMSDGCGVVDQVPRAIHQETGATGMFVV